MSYRIMIVDDSRVVYAEMKKMLEGSDIEIAGFCRSGEEALNEYENIHPDLVTMDIVMPGMDGLNAAEELLKRYPEAKILMVSSLAYDDMIDKAVEIGAKGFVFKPFEKDALLKVLMDELQKN